MFFTSVLCGGTAGWVKRVYECVRLDDEAVLNHGFFLFLGILIGLAMAWMAT